MGRLDRQKRRFNKLHSAFGVKLSSALAAPLNIQYKGNMMREITRINHVGLRVRDLEISRKFYEKLGFIYLAGPIGPEPVAIVEHPSGININFILNVSESAPKKNVLMEGDMKYSGYTHIALEITDYESAKSYIQGLDISITGEVEYNGAKFFFIRDPDGNVIEFHQPANS